MLRRRLLTSGMAGTVGVIASACGAPAQQTAVPTTVAQPTGIARPAGGKLYFLDHSLQKAVQDVTVKRLAEFQSLFPGTTIEHDDATPDNSGKFPVLVAAGIFPDVSVTHTAFVDQYPFFTDLTPYLARDGQVKAADYFPTVLNAFKVPVSGTPRQLGIPREAHATIMYFNRNAVAAAGAKEPTKDWTQLDFVDFGLKLRKWNNDPATATWGISGGTGLGGASSGLATFWSHGAEFFSEDGKQCLIDKGEAREAFQYMLDLIVKHHISPSPSEMLGSGLSGSTQAQFNTGRYAAYACNQNCSPITSGDQMSFAWDFMAVPQVMGRKRGTRLAANAYGLLTQGQNKKPDLGWELIKHLVGEQGSTQLVQGATLWMSNRKASEHWVTAVDRLGGAKNGKVVSDVLETMARREQTLIKGWGKAMAPINREWTAVQDGKQSIGEMINIAKAEAEAALKAEQAL